MTCKKVFRSVVLILQDERATRPEFSVLHWAMNSSHTKYVKYICYQVSGLNTRYGKHVAGHTSCLQDLAGTNRCLEISAPHILHHTCQAVHKKTPHNPLNTSVCQINAMTNSSQGKPKEQCYTKVSQVRSELQEEKWAIGDARAQSPTDPQTHKQAYALQHQQLFNHYPEKRIQLSFRALLETFSYLHLNSWLEVHRINPLLQGNTLQQPADKIPTESYWISSMPVMLILRTTECKYLYPTLNKSRTNQCADSTAR